MSTQGFSHWTDEMVAAHNAKFAPPNQIKMTTPIGLLAEAREREMKKKSQRLDRPPAFTLAPSKDEQKLNKTERALLAHLRALGCDWVGVQNITLKLADDCRLTPDFATLKDGTLTLWDAKGFQREDALIKMKVAARSFPFFKFIIASRDGGGWHMREVWG
jgi:hypothetical protein